jgi:hypothetical protein
VGKKSALLSLYRSNMYYSTILGSCHQYLLGQNSSRCFACNM